MVVMNLASFHGVNGKDARQHHVCAVPGSIALEALRHFKSPFPGLAGTGVNVWPLKSVEKVILS